MIFGYYSSTNTLKTCKNSFLDVVSRVESVFHTFRVIWGRILNFWDDFYRPDAEICGPQYDEFSEKVLWKSLSDSRKRVLSLKLSQNDVLTSTSYCQSMSIIALTVGEDYMICRGAYYVKSTFLTKINENTGKFAQVFEKMPKLFDALITFAQIWGEVCLVYSDDASVFWHGNSM